MGSGETLREVRRALVLCVLLTLFGSVPAQAAVAPGDVLVADLSFAGLYRVDPKTGAATSFAGNTDAVNASSPLFASPSDVTVDPTGRILVTDPRADGGTGAVIEVDPATGKQTLVSSNSQPVNAGSGLFAEPAGLEVLPSGVILVVDRNAFGFEGGVIAVDPATGKQTVFSSNEQPVNAGSQLFGDARGGIAVLPSGIVLVGDSGPAANGLIAVDPASGQQSIFSNDSQPVNAGTGFYEIPVDPLLTPDGALYVADQNAFGDGGIVGVDPASGKQSRVSSNDQPVNSGSGFFADPFNLALGTDGRILVADASAFGGACSEGCGGVIAVDRATGRQEVLSSNNQPVNAGGLPYENPLGVAGGRSRCAARDEWRRSRGPPAAIESREPPDRTSSRHRAARTRSSDSAERTWSAPATDPTWPRAARGRTGCWESSGKTSSSATRAATSSSAVAAATC